MKILFYQPYNQIVVYIESILEQFAKQGHETFFLSHASKGETHKNLEKFGCKTFSFPVKRKYFLQYYVQRIIKLVLFCRTHKIDIVYSHFQEANIIAVIAQFFSRPKFVITRHHSDCAFTDVNYKEQLGDQIINKLSKYYIATSNKVYKQMIEVEKVNAAKVTLINYGYNFNNFQKVNDLTVNNIRGKYAAKILLVMAARFIKEKRYFELLNGAETLYRHKIDFKLLLLGRGPLEGEIQSIIESKGLQNNVFIIGFKLNVMDYYAAADLVVHFSISEASNSAVKEAAITDTTVAVCNDVGDFDDYIIHGYNGFLLNKKNPTEDFIQLIKNIDQGKYNCADLGVRLHQTVIEKFDVSNVIHQYEIFNKQALNNKN